MANPNLNLKMEREDKENEASAEEDGKDKEEVPESYELALGEDSKLTDEHLEKLSELR